MERKTKESNFGIEVKAIIIDSNDNVLLLKKSKKNENWDFPSGKVMFGENVYNTVWRVVKEQTDLDVEIEGPSNIWTLKITEFLHTMCISFLCVWSGIGTLKKNKDSENEEIFLSNEYDDYEWLSSEKIINGEFPVWIKDEIKMLNE